MYAKGESLYLCFGSGDPWAVEITSYVGIQMDQSLWSFCIRGWLKMNLMISIFQSSDFLVMFIIGFMGNLYLFMAM